jgi:hypothetical protein
MRLALTPAAVDAIRTRVSTYSHSIERVAQVVKALGVLPVYQDVGGLLGLTPDGEILMVNDEANPPSVKAETDLLWLAIAVVNSARKCEELAYLLPTRPAGRKNCDRCQGGGHVRIPNVNADFGCICGGLGWIPEDPTELGLIA